MTTNRTACAVEVDPNQTARPQSQEMGLAEIIRRRLEAQTPSLMPLAESLALAARHDVTVLLTGETGTGKTYLARLIHDLSPRRPEPFLVVPCGALAASLIASEFFGHIKGAFTGADRPKIGKFAAAGRGTLLLDEIDALGLDQQARLLRVLETGEFEAVGSNTTQVCSARIIAVSNWNLEEAVARNKFRQDLYYRLNVMAFHLPPLRVRVQDIAPLARAMTAHFRIKFNKPLVDIAREALAALKAYPWPGNIRQLENGVLQAVLLSQGPRLLLSHLAQPIQDHFTGRRNPLETAAAPRMPLTAPAVNTPPSEESLARKNETAERSIIQKALMDGGYRRAHTAQALGISRVTLYKKMKKYGLLKTP